MPIRDKVIQLTACALFLLIGVGCVFGRVAFSPDGKQIATVVFGDWPEGEETDEDGDRKDPPYELWITDLETWEHRLVFSDAFLGVSPAWSPDGRELFFLRGEEEDMVLARWDGESVRDVVKVQLDGDPAVFTSTPPQLLPDGKSVIVTQGDPSDDDVLRVVRWDVATDKVTELAPNAGGAVLSPQGDRVVFLAYTADSDGLELCVMSTNGGVRRVLAKVREKLNDIGLSPLAWSPDGKLVAWRDGTEGTGINDHTSVYVAKVETGEIVFVTPREHSSLIPLFSADGEALFCALDRGEDSPHTMRADLSTGEIAAVAGGEGCVPAGVSPDGRYLALRRKGGTDRDNDSVVRIVELATGEYREDWVNERQHRVFAKGEIKAAEELARDLATTLQRAEEQLDAMERQFPVSANDPDVQKLRRRLDALRGPTAEESK